MRVFSVSSSVLVLALLAGVSCAQTVTFTTGCITNVYSSSNGQITSITGGFTSYSNVIEFYTNNACGTLTATFTLNGNAEAAPYSGPQFVQHSNGAAFTVSPVNEYNVTWSTFSVHPTAGGLAATNTFCGLTTLTAGTANDLSVLGCAGLGLLPITTNAVFYDILSNDATVTDFYYGFNSHFFNTPTAANRTLIVDNVNFYTAVAATTTTATATATTTATATATTTAANSTATATPTPTSSSSAASIVATSALLLVTIALAVASM